jgi:hypothetical protein
MTDAGQSPPLRVRWVLPSWLTLEQAQTYSSLSPLVLKRLIADRRHHTESNQGLVSGIGL